MYLFITSKSTFSHLYLRETIRSDKFAGLIRILHSQSFISRDLFEIGEIRFFVNLNLNALLRVSQARKRRVTVSTTDAAYA